MESHSVVGHGLSPNLYHSTPAPTASRDVPHKTRLLKDPRLDPPEIYTHPQGPPNPKPPRGPNLLETSSYPQRIVSDPPRHPLSGPSVNLHPNNPSF